MPKGIEESIYQYIIRMSAKFPELPYVFQDMENAGARDVNHILWYDKLPMKDKERIAIELMKALGECAENPMEEETAGKLETALKKTPVYTCFACLAARIRLCISENLIDKRKLYSLGMELATKSCFEEEVKLGILILGFFENDLTRQIIKTLGYHSSMTIYAVEASKNFHQHNEFIFDLVQNTAGFGKLAAIILFYPVLPNQKKWILEKGAINEVNPNMSAIMCLGKSDMEEYYENLEITRDTFSSLSYLLAYAAEKEDIKVFIKSLVLTEKYIKAVPVYARSFIDLAAMAVIKKSMAPYWNEAGEDIEKRNGWTSDRENEVRKICIEQMKRPRWKNVLMEELYMPFQSVSMILLTVREMNYKPHFEMLFPMLEKDLFDIDIMEYVLMDNADYYLEEVKDYLMQVMPEEVLEGNPLNIPDENVTDEHRPDIWLVFLLKAIGKGTDYHEEFLLKCLRARFPDARKEAIHALRTFKKHWSLAVLPALECAYEKEPVEKIRNRIQSLMGILTGRWEKKQTYADVSGIEIVQSPGDFCLMKTKIAGTKYYDMLVVEGRVGKDDILYLVREPDNRYDSKAIMITADDGYVLGYVPRASNTIPSTMMDAGEKLYGVLRSEDLEDDRPEIDIMVNKKGNSSF
ncbi:MAG: HIRAN domain-containing protein [Clostridiaceae bacterium]